VPQLRCLRLTGTDRRTEEQVRQTERQTDGHRNDALRLRRRAAAALSASRRDRQTSRRTPHRCLYVRRCRGPDGRTDRQADTRPTLYAFRVRRRAVAARDRHTNGQTDTGTMLSAFDAVPQLRCLRLAGNNIRVIYEDTFVSVPHLRVSIAESVS